MAICPIDGTDFVPARPHAKYCSKRCKKRAENAKRGGFDPSLPLCAPFDCAECGALCIPGIGGIAAHAKRFCGAACKKRWHSRSEWTAGSALRKRVTRRRMAERKLAAAAEGSCGLNIWAAGPCANCSASFTGWGLTAKFCSDRCWLQDRRRRARSRPAIRSARRRQAQRRNAAMAYRRQIPVAVVAERDGWLCSLCGLPTDKSKSAPHPESPTTDHKVPLSLGGSHEIENAQVAHFRCNSLKGTSSALAVEPATTRIRLPNGKLRVVAA